MTFAASKRQKLMAPSFGDHCSPFGRCDHPRWPCKPSARQTPLAASSVDTPHGAAGIAVEQVALPLRRIILLRAETYDQCLTIDETQRGRTTDRPTVNRAQDLSVAGAAAQDDAAAGEPDRNPAPGMDVEAGDRLLEIATRSLCVGCGSSCSS